jgi:ABC-type Mn2+/Zn2+ transport system permease subunit
MTLLFLYAIVAAFFTLVGFVLSRWLKFGGALGRHRALFGVACGLLLVAGLVATHFVAFNAWAGSFPDIAHKSVYARRANWGTGAAILLFISAGMVWPSRAKQRESGPLEPVEPAA